MCFHTAQFADTAVLEKRFGVKQRAERLPADAGSGYHRNGFAHPYLWVILQEAPDALVAGRWGLAPPTTKRSALADYYRDARRFGGGLNARAEKLNEHFLYRQLAPSQRCLVPVNGFYEPHERAKKKYPIYCSRRDGVPFALAGLYSLIEGLPCFGILTKAASPLFAKIHNQRLRQPVILPREAQAPWLEGQLKPEKLQAFLHRPYPDDELAPYPVSTNLFRPQINSDYAEILKEQPVGEFGI